MRGLGLLTLLSASLAGGLGFVGAAFGQDRLAIYYGWPTVVNQAADVEAAIAEFAHFEVIVLGAGVEDPAHANYAQRLQIVQALAAEREVYGYVDIGVSTANFSSIEAQVRIDAWAAMGATGVFFDNAGADFGVDKARFVDLVGRARPMPVFVNAWRPEDVFEAPNPLRDGDWYLAESHPSSEGVIVDLRAWWAKSSYLRLNAGSVRVAASATGDDGRAGFANQAAFRAALWGARVFDFEAFGWSNPVYSASGAANGRLARLPPVFTEVGAFTGPPVDGPGIYTRATTLGTLWVGPAGGGFRGGACDTTELGDAIWPSCSAAPPVHSAAFGPRLHAVDGLRYDFHRGVDLPTEVGSPVYAVGDGIVRIAGAHPGYADLVIQLRHREAEPYLYTQVQHLESVLVEAGDLVTAGDLVAFSGASESGFAHMHFEVREGCPNQPCARNPWGYLPFEEQPPPQPTLHGGHPGGRLVSMDVSRGRDQLDLRGVAIEWGEAPLSFDFDALNAASDPDFPLGLDHPVVSLAGGEVCILPQHFNAEVGEPTLRLAYRGLPPAQAGSARALDFSAPGAAVALEPALPPIVLGAPAQHQTLGVGATAQFEHLIQNKGEAEVALQLSVATASKGRASVDPTEVVLAPGAATMATVELDLDPDAPPGVGECVVLEVMGAAPHPAIAVDSVATAEPPPRPCVPDVSLVASDYGDPEGLLRGHVSCVESGEFRISAHIFVGAWYEKGGLASIDAEGNFSIDVTQAPNDKFATRYAAFLVPVGYTPPRVDGPRQLPQALSTLAAASSLIDRPPPPTSVNFAGRVWDVIHSDVGIGPGNRDRGNLFSHAPESVWVDPQGRLHLRIRRVGERWYCAALVSRERFGMGTWTWRVAGPHHALDPNVVLGLFSYDDEVEPDHSEIDIEIAQFRNPAGFNAQFVVAPAAPVRELDYAMFHPGVATHRFTWRPGRIDFQSFKGAGPPSYGDLIATWAHEGPDVHAESAARARINLWLFDSQPPADGMDQEVVLEAFDYAAEACRADTDEDGAPDCYDLCPNQDEGGDADADGFPDCVDACEGPERNADGDEAPDCVDGCPEDPAKVAPGLCDCGAPEGDSDGDGVPDCVDDCPADPAKVALGVCGCGMPETDADVDGSPDCIDGCPLDAAKVEAGVCGCGVADADGDGDGSADCADGCPEDPAKSAPGVCDCGVSDADGDGDGHADCEDGCPEDPAKTEAGLCGCGVADLDDDSDGSANCLDGCPNDSMKTEPGQCGCGVSEADRDGDGSPDCVDECPEDPQKQAAGACGCGLAEEDADEDGVLDCEDGCPGDPAKTEAGACGCGELEADEDGDGVFDCVDACPQAPGFERLVPTAGGVVTSERGRTGLALQVLGSPMVGWHAAEVSLRVAAGEEAWRCSCVDPHPLTGEAGGCGEHPLRREAPGGDCWFAGSGPLLEVFTEAALAEGYGLMVQGVSTPPGCALDGIEVGGPVASRADPRPGRLLVALDRSGSMGWTSRPGEEDCGAQEGAAAEACQPSRWALLSGVVEAGLAVASDLARPEDAIRALSFAEEASAQSDWSGLEAGALDDWLGDQPLGGASSIGAALQSVQAAFGAGAEQARQVVLLFTDGEQSVAPCLVGGLGVAAAAGPGCTLATGAEPLALGDTAVCPFQLRFDEPTGADDELHAALSASCGGRHFSETGLDRAALTDFVLSGLFEAIGGHVLADQQRLFLDEEAPSQGVDFTLGSDQAVVTLLLQWSGEAPSFELGRRDRRFALGGPRAPIRSGEGWATIRLRAPLCDAMGCLGLGGDWQLWVAGPPSERPVDLSVIAESIGATAEFRVEQPEGEGGGAPILIEARLRGGPLEGAEVLVGVAAPGQGAAQRLAEAEVALVPLSRDERLSAAGRKAAALRGDPDFRVERGAPSALELREVEPGLFQARIEAARVGSYAFDFRVRSEALTQVHRRSLLVPAVVASVEVDEALKAADCPEGVEASDCFDARLRPLDTEGGLMGPGKAGLFTSETALRVVDLLDGTYRVVWPRGEALEVAVRGVPVSLTAPEPSPEPEEGCGCSPGGSAPANPLLLLLLLGLRRRR